MKSSWTASIDVPVLIRVVSHVGRPGAPEFWLSPRDVFRIKLVVPLSHCVELLGMGSLSIVVLRDDLEAHGLSSLD